MSFMYIGSVAAQHYIPGPTNDVDAIADFDTAQSFLKAMDCTTVYPINKGKTFFGRNDKKIFEIEIAWPGSTGAELLELYPDMTSANLDVLYTLKMSHRYLRNSPHFHKTMRHIHQMRKLRANFPPELHEWYHRRMKETYTYAHPVLNQNKEGFFSGDGVQYKYDHDTLHIAVALRGAPMYTRYSIGEVTVSREKWNMLDLVDQQIAVYEEACVLALERSLIPHPGKKNRREAFLFALEKICTSITSGWFREFAWENFVEVVKLFDEFPAYDLAFQKALAKGKIKLYGQ